jgi:hypothetical protein
MKFVILMLTSFLFNTYASHAQLGGLLKKAKQAVKTVEKTIDGPNKSNSNNSTTNNTNSNTANTAATKTNSSGQTTERQKLTADNLVCDDIYTLIGYATGIRGYVYGGAPYGALNSNIDELYEIWQTIDNYKAICAKYQSLKCAGKSSTNQFIGLGAHVQEQWPGINEKLNTFIEKVYAADKTGNATETQNELAKLQKHLFVLRNFLADNTDFAALDNEVQDFEKKVGQKIETNNAKKGVTDFHKNNLFKMLFTNKPIDYKTFGAADVQTTLKATEPIYAILFLQDGFKTTYPKEKAWKKGMFIEMHFLVDNNFIYAQYGGASVSHYRYEITKEDFDEDRTYCLLELKPADLNKAKTFSPIVVADAMKGLSPRKHIFEFKLAAGAASVADLGKVTVDLAGFDADAYAQQASTARENIAFNQPLPANWFEYTKTSFASPAWNTATLRAKIAQYLPTALSDDIEFAQLLDARVQLTGTTEWGIEKNEFDVPISKSTDDIEVAFKAKNGRCYYIYLFLKQDYEGGGSYGPVRVTKRTFADPRPFNCQVTK